MRNVGFVLATILATLSLLTPANGAMPFDCGGELDPNGCHCAGTADCQDMRKSGMCTGLVTCETIAGQLYCKCDSERKAGNAGHQPPAAGGANPSPSGGKTIGVKPPPATGSQPSSGGGH
jgi:hypothetical protein